MSSAVPAVPAFSLVLAALGEVEQHASLVGATAVRIAAAYPGCILHLVHVVDVLPGAELAISENSWKYPGAEELRARSQALLDGYAQIATRALGRPVVPHLEYGPPATRILALAERLQPDLLVVGPLDKSRWQRFVFGSAADELLRKAPCTVVLARPKHRESPAEKR